MTVYDFLDGLDEETKEKALAYFSEKYLQEGTYEG